MVGSAGLGLYIAKEIVEAHNGRIFARSEPRPRNHFHGGYSGAGGSDWLTFWSLDDDRNIRRMVAATLDTAGHHVTEADSAEQALKLFPDSTADVVLSDVRMAGMNGFGLLTELKRLNPRVAGDH